MFFKKKNKIKNMVEGGISSKTYSTYNCVINIRGWFLSKETICAIVLCKNDIEIARTLRDKTREDVYKNYPHYNERNAGYEFSVFDDNVNNDTKFSIKVLGKNNITLTSIFFNIEVDNSIKEFITKLNEEKKVVFVEGGVDKFVFNKEEKTVIKDKDFIDINLLLNQLSQSCIDFQRASINYEEYYGWFNKVDYFVNYGSYVREFKTFLERKSLEHYLTLKHFNMMEADNGDNQMRVGGGDGRIVWLDVAASNSPFCEIVKRHYVENRIEVDGEIVTYKQDLNYDLGINGNLIGSSAENIPLGDGVVDYISLHCSFEHFENDVDFLFLNEAYRLLKKGGKICIIPIYLANKYTVVTSPSCYLNKYKNAKELPIFSRDVELCIIDDKIKQRQEKFFSVQVLQEQIVKKFSDKFVFTLFYYENYKRFNRAPIFSLVGEKK